MQKRLGILMALIVGYRFMAQIPVPLADPTQLRQVVNSLINGTQFGGFINLLSGGALASFSIVLVGLSPFITASVISQLLTKAIPSLEELHKDGESGRKKINQWTRIITVPLAIVQSIAFIYILRQSVLAGNSTVLHSTTPVEWVVAVTAMAAGAMILMWFGELITEQGVGNGISLLIFAGIISQIPNTFGALGQSLFDTSAGTLNVFGWFSVPVNPTTFWVLISIAVVSLIVLYFLVKVNESQRIIVVNYAKRVQGNSSYGGVRSILPLKMIAAGVIPVIFAVAFLSLPAFVGQVLKATGNPNFAHIANNLILWFQSPQPGSYATGSWSTIIYPLSYFLLVVLFTYFYTSIIFNTNEISENLQKQGGFIEGIRPGEQTEKYLSRTMNRLVLFGSLVLGIISVMPFVAQYIFAELGITTVQNLAIGGTGVLIVVAVALQNLREVNSRALMVTYDDYE